MNGPFSGVLVPALTPFDAALNPDAGKWVGLCQSLLASGADGLALFGTTSEANSMNARERRGLLAAICQADLPGEKMMVGIGSCSISETVELLDDAAARRVAGALLLPPFFYKGAAAGDDGLFDFVAAVMQRTAGCPTRIYLYHIPPIAHVGWSVPLVGRLIEAFPDRIAGLKDSSGDWSNTAALIEAYPDLDIFPGSDEFLLQGLRAGAVGCITATGNINAPGIAAVYDQRDSDDADRLQQQATEVRLAVLRAGNPIVAMKAYIALKTGDADWARVRPPLRPLTQQATEQLDTDLTTIGFQLSLP